MIKPDKRRNTDAPRAEYDFTGGVRAKYAARVAQGTNLVLLAPDVAKAFPNANAVNRALRAYQRILRAIPKNEAKV